MPKIDLLDRHRIGERGCMRGLLTSDGADNCAASILSHGPAGSPGRKETGRHFGRPVSVAFNVALVRQVHVAQGDVEEPDAEVDDAFHLPILSGLSVESRTGKCYLPSTRSSRLSVFRVCTPRRIPNLGRAPARRCLVLFRYDSSKVLDGRASRSTSPTEIRPRPYFSDRSPGRI